MVLCVGTQSSPPVVFKHTKHDIRQQRSALTRICCLMYCMVFCVFGLVFPICDVLTKSSDRHRLYSEVFLILVMMQSIVILGYFFIYILRQGGKSSAEAGRDELEKALENMNAGSETSIDNKAEGKIPGVTNGSNGTQGHKAPRDYEPPSSTEIGPPLSMAEEGLNLYTRIGTVVFALGAVILKVLRIIEPFDNNINMECVSKVHIFTQTSFLVFLGMETVFIFKFHQVVINKHKPFVRICLVHLIAANMSVWLSACTTEIVEDVGEMFADEKVEETNANETLRCHHIDTIADKVAPYTFPCLIEFSLIAASAAFKMYLNVGKVIEQEQAAKDGGEESVVASQRSLASYKSEHVKVTCATFRSLWRGFDNIIWLIFGIIVSAFVSVGVVVFLVIREGDLEVSPENYSTYVYVCTELVALFSCLVAVCFGFKYIHNLKFHPLEKDTFDDKLLIMAQGGVFTYSTLLGISAISDLAGGYQDTTYLYLIRAILNFVQSGIQTVFVLDSMRRCAGHEDHVRRKPGRAVISFLVMVNLAMWLVNTFEMEKAEVSGVRVIYFDRVAWSVVSHMLVPLVIFYRYHTTVCLSEVWVNAYEMRKEE
ncbi:proton channel OtopLc-like isoform X2 [Lineus longissimus]|uniref:proton channel OtopLc-like isoform X2 n=1 Tax=Lineus longissimus TaxID=88925 RepID=UPI002B4F7FC0